MQCPTLTEPMSTLAADAGELASCTQRPRRWSQALAEIFADRGATHDTSRGVWDTCRPGVDMSSRPFLLESVTGSDESTSEEPLASGGTDIADALRQGDAAAVAKMFDLYGAHVERVLLRTIGRDGEMEDMVQDVFLGAYRSGHNYQGNDAQLKAWISRIAVFTARGYLRKRKRRWWLRSAAPADLPEQRSKEASPHTHEVLRRTYAALDEMDPNLRIPLALRELEAMELTEIAEACECSVSTVKRRLNRARKAFERLAKKDPILRDWLEDDKQ